MASAIGVRLNKRGPWVMTEDLFLVEKWNVGFSAAK
jgi:hypothetical protein